ncbi:hypothetical protein Goari_026884, partial [Gossypium aridum]|nr:hypothetical protein [Gossypium aridum]
TKLLGPFLKLAVCIFLPVVLILWVVVGIVGSILGGILYGFLSPMFATFDAVGEGKTNVFIHCFYDGTWSTIKGSFTVVKDFKDVCVHSYYSFMEELRQKDGQYYEIRLAVKFSLPILSHVVVMAKSIIYLIQKSFITKEHYGLSNP